MAQCADSGAPLLRASRGPGSHFADDRPAASDELVRDERVHDLLRSAGSSEMPVLRACGTDGCSSGCAVDEHGDLLAKAGVAGYEREHSALQVLLSAGDGVPGLVREHSALQVSQAAAVGEQLSLQVDFASRLQVAERDQLGCPVASRLRPQARSSCLDLRCLSDFVSSSRLGHLFPSPRLVDARVGHTNASVDTSFARVNSWGTLHAARTNSGGHANSYRCTYNSCGGVRGGTKPRSMSTRDQVGCPAVEKLASLQQAPGRLHVETWAGRNQNSNLPISQAVEIMSGCADMVACLPPPFFSSVSPGPGREARNGMGWSLLEKTARSGVWLFLDAFSWSSVFFAFAAFACWVQKGSFLTAWAVPPLSSCSCAYLYGRGTAIGPQSGERCWPLLDRLWRAIAPLMKPWCAEGDVPTAANLNLYRGRSSHVGWHSDDEPLFGERGESKLIVSVSFGTQALFKWKGKSCPSNDGQSCWLGHGDSSCHGWPMPG